MSLELTAADREQLAELEIPLQEAQRQLDLLSTPPPRIRLSRPCRAGDGIRELGTEQRAELLRLADDLARSGRLSKFVPASGAASRMFAAAASVRASGVRSHRDLEEREKLGDGHARDVMEMLDARETLPFADALAEAIPEGEGSGVAAVLDALLGSRGLNYGACAKGLIPFHRYGKATRTAFEEHLVEGAGFLAAPGGRSRFHFTVVRSEAPAFELLVERAEHSGLRLDVSFSSQIATTDTLALEPGKGPVRDSGGRLVLRPGGHGALLGNLEAIRGDLVLIKNIDNIVTESRQSESIEWQKILLALLAREQDRIFAILETLGSERWREALDGAEAYCRATLSQPIAPASDDGRREALLDRLSRPLRVCGMVRNQGEPGGGPFWVQDGRREIRPQIVEAAQVDREDSEQEARWRASTHFNPVLLAVAPRRFDGSSFRLSEFVDEDSVIVSEKPLSGRRVRVLEHPGLWNGAMARWNTLFVQVPLTTFAPVKTVLDLLRPEHQGA